MVTNEDRSHKSVQSHVTHDQKQRYLFNEFFLSFVKCRIWRSMPQNYNPTIFLPAQSQLFLGGFSFVADSFDRPSIGRYNRNVHLDSVPLMVPFMSVIQWRSLEHLFQKLQWPKQWRGHCLYFPSVWTTNWVSVFSSFLWEQTMLAAASRSLRAPFNEYPPASQHITH